MAIQLFEQVPSHDDRGGNANRVMIRGNHDNPCRLGWMLCSVSVD